LGKGGKAMARIESSGTQTEGIQTAAAGNGTQEIVGLRGVIA